MNRTIAQVANIHEDILDDYSKSRDLSVEQKMKWMENRSTTHTEDMAYCLLGVFDVSMPLLHGEGYKALMRLGVELDKPPLEVLDNEELSVLRQDGSSNQEQTPSLLSRMIEQTRSRAPPKSLKRDTLPVISFNCQYMSCVIAGVTFRDMEDSRRHCRVAHKQVTLQLHNCEHPGCHRRGRPGFIRKDQMTKHMQAVHRLKKPVQPHDPGLIP